MGKGGKGVEASSKKRHSNSPLSASTPSKPSAKKTKQLDGNMSGVSFMEDSSGEIERLVSEIEVKAAKGKQEATHDHLVTAAEKAITNLLPRIVEAISGSVVEIMHKKMEEMENKIVELENDLKKERILNVMRQDKHEQFTRRDNVVVEGIKEKNQGEETRETLILSVQAVANSIGVRMNKESVGDIHRVGRRRDGKPRPVVIHTNRWNKTTLMANKKKLRENGAIKDDAQFCERVSLYEDLTKARRNIFKTVKTKESDNVAFCFTKDGSIVTKMKNGQFVTIDDADDLFKIGIDQVDYSAFYDGLPHYTS